MDVKHDAFDLVEIPSEDDNENDKPNTGIPNIKNVTSVDETKFFDETKFEQADQSGSNTPVIILSDESDSGCDAVSVNNDSTNVKKFKKAIKEHFPLFSENAGSSTELHLDDTKNKPMPDGRVVINESTADDDGEAAVATQIARALKPHQIGGIRFMYDNIVGSLDKFKEPLGSGCILAHSMGLGKTLQIIVHKVLCIVPVNTLCNWVDEFRRWLPEKENFGFKQESSNTLPTDYRQFNLYVMSDGVKRFEERHDIIKWWSDSGGVLIIGYEMFRLLASNDLNLLEKRRRPKKKRKKQTATSQNGAINSNDTMVIDLEEEDVKREKLIAVYHALLDPGADVVFCDEGHRIKNYQAEISKALAKIKTRRRVVLTGYPLQNNLLEYWCMVDFVRPGYLGNRLEFSSMFIRPINNGQCQDSTPADTQLMKYRSYVLHRLLEAFVQRRRYTVLANDLPRKVEYVLLLKLTPIQLALYNAFVQYALDSKDLCEMDCATNPIIAFSVCCKIWNHPDILYNATIWGNSLSTDLDTETVIDDTSQMRLVVGQNGEIELVSVPSSSDLKDFKDVRKPNGIDSTSQSTADILTSMNSDGSKRQTDCDRDDKVKGLKKPVKKRKLDLPMDDIERTKISYEWADNLFDKFETGDIMSGYKFVVFFGLLEEAVSVGDKVLVFSQSLYTLDALETFLAKATIPGTDRKWKKNTHYFRLDGSTQATDREASIKRFNLEISGPSWLFLLSTRAGCLGINLTGANRVIVMDASWNPCHDCQAVCRIYRYGQTKPCYVYRLISDGTMERRIFDRQISKHSISNRVVDAEQPECLQFTTKSKNADSLLLYKEPEIEPVTEDDLDAEIEDPVLLKVLKTHSNTLTAKPFFHDVMLLDRVDLRLSAVEKRLAEKSYHNEWKQMRGTLYPPCTSRQFNNEPHSSITRKIPDPVSEVLLRRKMEQQRYREQPRLYVPPLHVDRSTFNANTGDYPEHPAGELARFNALYSRLFSEENSLNRLSSLRRPVAIPLPKTSFRPSTATTISNNHPTNQDLHINNSYCQSHRNPLPHSFSMGSLTDYPVDFPRNEPCGSTPSMNAHQNNDLQAFVRQRLNAEEEFRQQSRALHTQNSPSCLRYLGRACLNNTGSPPCQRPPFNRFSPAQAESFHANAAETSCSWNHSTNRHPAAYGFEFSSSNPNNFDVGGTSLHHQTLSSSQTGSSHFSHNTTGASIGTSCSNSDFSVQTGLNDLESTSTSSNNNPICVSLLSSDDEEEN